MGGTSRAPVVSDTPSVKIGNVVVLLWTYSFTRISKATKMNISTITIFFYHLL